MMDLFKSYLNSLAHLVYPQYCEGCNSDVLADNAVLCARCLHALPETGFTELAGNPVEKVFYGRIIFQQATSCFYFTKDSLLQHLLVQLKYKGNKEIGLFLGRQLGYALQQSERFKDVEALIPLPLNKKKEHMRGYNQADIICQGIAMVWDKPVLRGAVARAVFTDTQTHQNRIDRWQNVAGAFVIANELLLKNKHLLLVDDVVTTGASLEACGAEILKVANTKLSIATVAYTI